ncbi:MAG: hypothetical protein ABIW31_06155 [Novosphingobium sp.]
MKKSPFAALAVASAALALTLAGPAEARHHYRGVTNNGHHNCLRFNKTTGAVAGGVAGAVLGKVIFGSTGGLLGGAAAGGIAGHELANNRVKRCR